MAVKSKLAQELLVNADHLRWTIMLMTAEGATDVALSRFREQLHLVEDLDTEVGAAMYVIERDGLPEKAVADLTKARDLALSYLKLEDRFQSRTIINNIRKLRMTFFNLAADKKATKMSVSGATYHPGTSK